MKNIKVLIVDDTLKIVKGLTYLFSNYEVEVVGSCSDGGEVLDFIDNNETDVIVMDYFMKKVHGDEAISLVREKYPLLKIIGFSNDDAEFVKNNMLRAGANHFLLKNIDADILIKAIMND